ncbi:hypothetical protein CPB85DRAFT_1354751 [Mucidula mucida]|nr:hypothetical protein CPB85DRAFT_1354751 [Mucidula mucida]
MQSNFPSICANSPHLQTLLYLRQCSAPLSCFVDSPAVLRSLSFVSLHDMPHMDELWTLLRREEIYLSKMDVDRVSGDLIDYVLAYEGLEVLKLRCENDNPFWREVVGRHRETLRELEVIPRFEGVWFFRCTHLETLRVSFNFRSISDDLMYLMSSVQPSLGQLFIDSPPLCSPRHGPPPHGKSEGAARIFMERTVATCFVSKGIGGSLECTLLSALDSSRNYDMKCYTNYKVQFRGPV